MENNKFVLEEHSLLSGKKTGLWRVVHINDDHYNYYGVNCAKCQAVIPHYLIIQRDLLNGK